MGILWIIGGTNRRKTRSHGTEAWRRYDTMPTPRWLAFISSYTARNRRSSHRRFRSTSFLFPLLPPLLPTFLWIHVIGEQRFHRLPRLLLDSVLGTDAEFVASREFFHEKMEPTTMLLSRKNSPHNPWKGSTAVAKTIKRRERTEDMSTRESKKKSLN